MKIDIIVDTICPWCYVGKKRFERALASSPVEGLEVGWRPFQLNPHMPREGMDRGEYLAQKFGGPRRAESQYRVIEETGRDEGIDFRFSDIDRTPNSIDSHRLVRLAGENGLQTQMVEAVFQAYFLEGRDIGSRTVLAEIGAENGMDFEETIDYLTSGRDVDIVRSEDQMARNMGVNGVPCYIVERNYAISGAQSPEVFAQVFDFVRQEGAEIAAE